MKKAINRTYQKGLRCWMIFWSLPRFWLMFGGWKRKLIKGFVYFFFAISLRSCIQSLAQLLDGEHVSVYDKCELLLCVLSLFWICKELVSFFVTFSMRGKKIVSYKGRNDRQVSELRKMVLNAGCKEEELKAGWAKEMWVHGKEYGIKPDSYFYHSGFNLFLQQGGVVWAQATNRSDWLKSRLYDKIHENFDDCWNYLILKRRCAGRGKFFNEFKVNLVSQIPVNEVRVKHEVTVDVSKTCYYASYITNEFYRDLVMIKDEKQWRSEQGADFWRSPYLPFDVKGKMDSSGQMTSVQLLIPEFTGRMSEHIGANTIVVTKDGRLLVVIQKEKAALYSQGLVAPTGSGSMDWGDFTHIEKDPTHFGRRNLNEAIKKAATRELDEETCLSGGKMDTYVIGFYRWTSRGGLPGFLCLTRTELDYDKLCIEETGETEFSKDVNDELNGIKFSLKDDQESKKADVQAIKDYVARRDKDRPLSMPLYANLLALRDGIIDDSKFWANHGVNCSINLSHEEGV